MNLTTKQYRKVLRALNFYAKGRHFSYCGLVDNEPETVSGEPVNFLSGGCEMCSFELEDGWVAKDALKALRVPTESEPKK